MLENLAYLHHSHCYECKETIPNSCLPSPRDWVSLSLALCTCLAQVQTADATTNVGLGTANVLPLLKYGSTGQAVVALQTKLKKANCFPQSTRSTGYYGKITRAAVTRLQQQNGLRVDGIAGHETHNALLDAKTCSASSAGASEYLKLGSQGETVRLLQIQLNNWGFPLDGERLEPDGKFGYKTQNALEEFERFFELKPDGIFSSQDSEYLWKSREAVKSPKMGP